MIARPPNFFRACLFFMLKDHLQQLGINPRIIQLCLMEYLEITQGVNDELMAVIDPIAYQKNQLTVAQLELLIAYLL